MNRLDGAVRWIRAEWQTVSVLLSLILAVFGLVFGFYWYLNPKLPTPSPSFAILPNRGVLAQVSAPESSGLGITFDSKPVLGQDVVVLTLFFWNNGSAPMRSSEVLSPFQIRISGNARILDARVIAQTRQLCRLRMTKSQEIDLVELGFDVLERGDGGKVQLVYSGKRDATVQMMGTVIGATRPEEVRIVDGQTRLKGYFIYKLIYEAMVVLFLIMFAMLTDKRMYSEIRRSQRAPGHESRYPAVFVAKLKRESYWLWALIVFVVALAIWGEYSDIRDMYFPLNSIPRQLYRL